MSLLSSCLPVEYRSWGPTLSITVDSKEKKTKNKNKISVHSDTLVLGQGPLVDNEFCLLHDLPTLFLYVAVMGGEGEKGVKCI